MQTPPYGWVIDVDDAKLVRLRKLALEIVELTQGMEEPERREAPRQLSAKTVTPTLEDYIELRRLRRRRRARG